MNHGGVCRAAPGFAGSANEFPIVFNILVNMFCKAEGFNCMQVRFEFGLYSIVFEIVP